MKNTRVPLVGFVAASGTGKTTLLVQLIAILQQRGLRVGVIKHSHHDFVIDHAGKDSFRLRAAGASPVMLTSSYRRALISEKNPRQEPQLDDELRHFEQSAVDLILIEGFRQAAIAKIELHRAELQVPLLYENDANIIAVATDTTLNTPAHIPCLNINQPKQIVDFILQQVIGKHTALVDVCSTNKSLLTLEHALARIKSSIHPINASETITLSNALERVLATTVCSPINLPFERNAAMDGYAFNSTDLIAQNACTLTCVGTSWAGQPFTQQLQARQCVRIFTGAVVPETTDSVIMQEQVRVDGNAIHLPINAQPYQNVRAAGEDLKQGDVVVGAGKKLTAMDVSLLAAVGVVDVSVKRQLRIAIFSTGDELIAAGQPLSSGKIYDSNRYLLHGLLHDAAYSVTDGGVLADDPAQIEASFTTAAANHDVIISTGGASVGDADYIRDVLARCGTINFWQIAIKPGKPLAFGTIAGCYFFGLPGNPVAVMTTFTTCVSTALQQLSGMNTTQALRLSATCTSRLKKSAGRQEYQRGILSQNENGEFLVASAGQQGSHILSSLSRANCTIILAADCQGVSVGEQVSVEPFDTFI